MHAELRWGVFTLNMVTRRNRVIASVRRLLVISDEDVHPRERERASRSRSRRSCPRVVGMLSEVPGFARCNHMARRTVLQGRM